MRNRISVLCWIAAAAFLLIVGQAGLGNAWAADCTLQRIAELPLEDNEAGSPIVSVLIDGRPKDVLLDTGGFWSLIDPSQVGDWRKRVGPIEGRLGLSAIRLMSIVRVPSVQIGPLKLPDPDFFVTPDGYLKIDATLGANILSNFDVEVDPVGKTVSLFSQDHCDGQVIHWRHSDLAVVPFRRIPVQQRITIPITLDGHEIRALIDTGSTQTTLSLRAAERLFGLKPDSPGVQESGRAMTKDGGGQPLYRYQFKSLEMDGITFKNPWLNLASIDGGEEDLILGMHQLRGLHLYFAYKERKLYATSAAGDIAARKAQDDAMAAASLPEGPGPLDEVNAQDLLKSAQAAIGQHDYATAKVDLDRALKLDPGYSDAYLLRAAVDAAKGDRDGARRDLAEALRTDPKSSGAYLVRSHLFEQIADYGHAYDDADHAVKLSPKSPAALNARCWIGAIRGQLAAALSDCDAALALDPHQGHILDSRAFVHLKAGQFDEAIKDYDAALDRQPRDASSLYGRGLAKRETGDRAGGDVDIAAAKQVDSAIESHFGK
jgi:tetratricopeptide (TPR) repeat protein